MLSIWDWFQQRQIKESQDQASGAQLRAHRALSQVEELERRLETLSLLCRALVEELGTVTEITEDQLKARMLEIDLRDGKEDGKYTPPSVICRGCGRKVAPRRGACMWCGAKI